MNSYEMIYSEIVRRDKIVKSLKIDRPLYTRETARNPYWVHLEQRNEAINALARSLKINVSVRIHQINVYQETKRILDTGRISEIYIA